jgi:acyl-CoA synthetase (AMP-forming)/AMP-acid ligase II
LERPAGLLKRGVEVQGAKTFAGILEGHAARRPGDLAFVFLDKRGKTVEQRTYAALDERARTVAASLAEREVTGAPVLLNFPPGLAFVDALFGCFYAGCIAVPAPYAIAKRLGERIESICRDCDPAAMLTLARFDNETRARGELPRAVERIAPIFVDALPSSPHSNAINAPSVESIALLQYTSGSTSAPKGVMLSHENLVANSEMIGDMFGEGPDVRGVGWLPLFHDMGLIGHVLQPVFNGGLSVLMSPLTFLQRPLTWLEAIAEWKATASGGPTYAFELCTNRISDEQAAGLDLSSWRVAYCGSEPIRAETLERFADKFAASGLSRGAIYPCYGLAEATLMVTGGRRGAGLQTTEDVDSAMSNRGDYSVRPKSVACGRACAGETVVIVDPDTGQPVDDGEVGEIWVSGLNVGRGYWRRPQETADVFGARLDGVDGAFLRTGDLGFVQDGEIFVVGRIKDMIIVRGTNHAPADIESTVASCYASFAGAAQAAFSIERSGREEVIVVLEVRAELSDEETAAVFEQVSRHHGLRLYDLVLVPVCAIPRTSSGKVRRGRCRELYAAGLLDRQNDPGDLRFLGVNVEARAALATA